MHKYSFFSLFLHKYTKMAKSRVRAGRHLNNKNKQALKISLSMKSCIVFDFYKNLTLTKTN